MAKRSTHRLRSLSSLLVLGLVFAGLIYFAINRTANSHDSSPSISTSQPATSQRNKDNISALIVPHHDLVSKQRAEFFKIAKQELQQPKTIILVSPNHYESGKALIQTSDQTWQLTDGVITSNQLVIKELVAEGVGNEPTSFINEHGIKSILADIRRTFPKAQLVPIILKSDTTSEQVNQLHKTLDTSCNDCLMITSVDFSHYQPALLANLHDGLSKRLLENLDQAGLMSRAEVDSPAALALLVEWAKSHDTKQLVIKNQTNSGTLTGDIDGETTTHLFAWYQGGDQVKPEPSVSFAIGGDMMFGRMIAHTFLKQGLWQSLIDLTPRLFWGTDAGLINLEGPVSATPVADDIRPDNLVFNFPPETIEALRFFKVNGASLANNHSHNAGSSGLATTRELLRKAAIQPIGGPTASDTDQVASFSGEGLTLDVIGVHALVDTGDISQLIKKLKADPSHRVLVFPHWGAEYQLKHGQSQANLAHQWIDAGADLVVGAHPHVVEDSEVYKGRPIFYSLGNLLFDQTFSQETQQGLVVAGAFTHDGLRLFALPTQSTKLSPALVRDPAKKSAILDTLYKPLADFRQSSAAGDVLFFPN